MKLAVLLFVAICSYGQTAASSLLVGGVRIPVTPTDSPGTGSYGSTQSVTLASVTSTTIYYTIDGSTPACPPTGTLYSGAISVAATTTVKAIGCNGITGSGVLSSTYTISGGGTPTSMGHTNVRTDGTTSSSIDTTATGTGGAAGTLIVVMTTCYAADQAPTAPIDSQGNTYTGLTYRHNGNNGQNGQFWYVINPTNSTTMTWHVTATNCTNGWMAIGVWSGTGALDSGTDVGAYTSGASPLSIPTINVSQTNDLVLFGWAGYTSLAPTISGTSGISIIENTGSLVTSDGSFAWVLYNSTSALNVDWSMGGGFPPSAGFGVAFKHQ